MSINIDYLWQSKMHIGCGVKMEKLANFESGKAGLKIIKNRSGAIMEEWPMWVKPAEPALTQRINV